MMMLGAREKEGDGFELESEEVLDQRWLNCPPLASTLMRARVAVSRICVFLEERLKIQ